MKETVGNIDLVVAADDSQKVMDYFASMLEISEVLGKWPTKTFVLLNNGMNADLLVVPKKVLAHPYNILRVVRNMM